MWKGVFKSRLGKASLFQAPSKMWNGVFINARQSKSVPSTLKTLGCTVFTQMNLFRVHMTAVHSAEFRKGKNMAEKVTPMKVSLVVGTEFQKGKNMAEKVTRVIESPDDAKKVRLEEELLKSKEGISKPERSMSFETQLARLEPMYDEAIKHLYSVQSAGPSSIPSIGTPLKLEQRFSLPVEELWKAKTQSQKILKLVKEFSKLEEELGKLEAMEVEHPETWGSDHEYGRKKMELLARVEPLYDEAKSYEFSAQSDLESFIISVLLSRFEFQLEKRSSCDPGITDTSVHIPLDHSSQILKNSDQSLELNRLREAYPKVSHIQGNLAEFWKLNSFPTQAEYFLRDDLLKEWVDLARKLVHLLKFEVRKYPQDIEKVASESPLPEAGKFFDVFELLSRFPGDLICNNGDRSRVALNPDTFKGKYVLICCFHVPVLPVDGSYFPFIVNLCKELYSTRDDFEMVVVARMNNLANDEEVFHHFLSGLPKSCLAVPFEDNQRIDYICKVFGLSLHHKDKPECLLLNGEGIAEGIVLPHLSPPDYVNYGAEGFPFTDDILYKRDLELKDMIFEKEGNWLERVLRCNDSSPDTVYKFNPSGRPRKKVSISQFSKKHKNKHVGLYLCSGGQFIPYLLDMYKECREEELDFEVVVVCMPFAIITDPKILQEKIDRLLKKHNVCDWWCLPFSNSVSVRFFNLNRFYEVPGSSYVTYNCDKFIMVGPDVDHLDIYGAHVMWRQGIDAYPFTVEAGIELVESDLEEITLESLFVDGDVSVSRGNDGSDSRQIGQLLKGKKNIILCIGYYGDLDYKTLASIYHETKILEKEDFEMVFVARPRSSDEKFPYHEMPWYICPKNGTNSTNLEELLSCIELNGDVLVGFGEDGQICFCRTISKVTWDARFESKPAYQRFSLVNSLYRDIEHLLGYDEFMEHGMGVYANPRLGRAPVRADAGVC